MKTNLRWWVITNCNSLAQHQLKTQRVITLYSNGNAVFLCENTFSGAFQSGTPTT